MRLPCKKTLSNFCVVVLKNGRFRRFNFPFEKSIQQRLSDEAGCCLFYFGTSIGSKGILSWIISFGDVDAGWAILVHEPGRLTNRLPGNPALVGGQFLMNTPSGRRYDTPCISPG